MEYEFIEEDKKNTQPLRIRKLTPIQMPHIDMDEVKNGRKAFTKDEWMDILLRSTGLEPDRFSERAKWLLIARMIPLVENNFNLCELGPRSTGKSYIYEQISPNSILVAADRQRLPTSFITCPIIRLVLLVCGTVWLLMRLPVSSSKIKMVSRL